MSHLQLNFFSVVFPDGVELPILTRKLADGEDLRAHEQLLKPKSSLDLASNSRTAGAVRHLEAGQGEYVVEKRALRDLPIGIVRRLVEEGLRRTLAGRGILIEHALTEFHCFRPDDFYSTDTPSFLRIRRGVQFRSDCIYVLNRPVFGFFVSSKSRVYFAGGVTEPAVAQAAIGARVWADSPSGSTSGKLLEVRNGSAKLAVQRRHEDTPREIEVAVATVQVPGSIHILRAYCQKLPSGATALRQALAAPKRAAGRITASGTKNSRWAIYEFDQVAMWLNSVSSLGRVAFTWPNSEVELALDAHPAELRLTS